MFKICKDSSLFIIAIVLSLKGFFILISWYSNENAFLF